VTSYVRRYDIQSPASGFSKRSEGIAIHDGTDCVNATVPAMMPNKMTHGADRWMAFIDSTSPLAHEAAFLAGNVHQD
jgi:hypothetical protein